MKSDVVTFFEILSKAIVKIVDNNGNDILFNKCYIKPLKSKYSLVESPTLYINDEPLTSNKRNYRVYYNKCRCNKILII